MTSWIRTWCNAAALLPLALNLAAQPRDLASLIQSGNRQAALERIRAGADVNAAQPDGTRPLHWAVFRVDHELVAELLARNAQVNVRNEFGSWPLAEAAKLGEARLVRMLLDAGADPEAANDDGQTALMLAVKGGFLPVVEMLLDAGAQVNVVEQFQRQTPLMWAAAAAHNAAPMVRLLLDRGADPRPRSRFRDWESQISSEPRAQYRPTGGHTALLYAARNGCSECVAALLDAGADIDQPTPEGVTALMLAVDNGYNDTARLLLDRGANPHLWDWWGRTALYIAVDRRAAAGRSSRAGQDTLELIQALLDRGVDVNPQLNMHRPSRGGNSGRFSETQLSTGCTPLLRAALANDLEVMRLLLARGANPNINAMGVTAFLVAAGVGGRGGAGEANLALLDVMFQNGAEVNTQVSGTATYTLRVSRSPATNEGMTALHAAAQRGRADWVKYLLEKGANPRIRDANGRTPLDLAGEGPAAAGGSRGAPAEGNPAEVRALLEAAAKQWEPGGDTPRLSR
jgi:ankyrin repeat protein